MRFQETNLKQAQKENREMEQLISLSMYKDLVFVSNSKEEADNHIRQLYFSDMESPIAKRYLALNPNGKAIVGKLVETLTKGHEHQGFNLTLYLYWLRTQGVKRHKIAKHLEVAHFSELLDINEQIDSSEGVIYLINERKKAKSIQKARKKSEDSEESEEGTKTIVELLSENLLFNQALLKQGRGEIEDLTEEALEQYNEATEFHNDSKKYERRSSLIIDDKKEDDLLTDSIRETIIKFAKYLGKSWDDIVEKKYAVINYTYGYQYLLDTEEEWRNAPNELEKIAREKREKAEALENSIAYDPTGKKARKARKAADAAQEKLEKAKKAIVEPPERVVRAIETRELIDYIIGEFYAQQTILGYEQMLIDGGATSIDPGENPDE